MSVYLIINIAIIIVPLLLSFESKIRFYRNYRYLFPAIIITGIFFVAWDHIATLRGDWSFNPEYISGLTILSLPVEEILFFITAPYSLVFIFETLSYYVADRQIAISGKYLTLAGPAFAAAAIGFSEKEYTFVIFSLLAIYWLISGLYNSELHRRKIYWIFIALSYVPFIIVNYLLTALPVVSYSDSAITGVRFFSIPVEDFFYSFALISINLSIYSRLKNK